MYKLLTSKGQLIAIIIGVLGVAISLLSIIFGIKGAGYTMSDDLNKIMKTSETANFDFFLPALYVVTALIIFALVAALVYGIIGLVSDPKGSMKGIIGLALVAVLFLVLYSSADLSASSAKIIQLVEKNNISDSISRMISGGVKTAVIAAVIALVAAVVMEILNLFK